MCEWDGLLAFSSNLFSFSFFLEHDGERQLDENGNMEEGKQWTWGMCVSVGMLISTHIPTWLYKIHFMAKYCIPMNVYLYDLKICLEINL